MDYAEAREYLIALRNPGSKYGIDRMRLLCDALAHPERVFPVIHVAGTNGKGSVCAMLESIYRQAGYRTGLYTSPHLVHLGERVQVNRQNLSAPQILEFVRTLKPLAEALGQKDPADQPSFFELMTAMAFLHFAKAAVQVGIIEVGLGGRLDATNIVLPEVSVITSIGLDHTEILGESLEKIAAEKAGIIKPRIPVVVGRVPAAADEVISRTARERGAPLHRVTDVFGEDLSRYPETGLEGTFQRINAATATLVARLASPKLPVTEDAIRNGLLRVTWPGRWQRFPLDARRELILDASHNPEGATVLDENLGRLAAQSGQKPIVIAGVLGEYRAQALLPVAARHAKALYLVKPNQPRATELNILRTFVPHTFSGPVHGTTLEELFPRPGTCALGDDGDTVVVTGSIYLLGEVCERFLGITDAASDTDLQDRP